MYTTSQKFVNCESETGEIVPRDWSKIVQNDDLQGLRHLGRISGNRHCFTANQMRQNFMKLFQQ